MGRFLLGRTPVRLPSPWLLLTCLALLPACGRLGYGGTVPGIRESDAGTPPSTQDDGGEPFPADGALTACDGVGCVRACDELPGAVVFCDEFDVEQLDPEWTTEFGFEGPDPVVDRTVVHSGAGSLHFTASAASSSPKNYLVHDIDEVPGNDVYVRAYVWYPPEGNQGALFLRVVASAPYPDYQDMVAITKPDSTMLFGLYDQSNEALVYGDPAAPMPRGQWACVQLHIVRGPVGGGAFAELTVNGVSAGAFTDHDTTYPVTSLQLGPYANSVCAPDTVCDAPPEIYIDQLAVGSAELPCD